MKEYICTLDMARAADAAAPKYGVSLETLMDNAAKALYNVVKEYEGKILVLCGKGNNGGDGYAMASLLLADGRDVLCVQVVEGEESELCKKKREALPEDLVINMAADFEPVQAAVDQAGIIVDCIFGTGFEGGPMPVELRPIFTALVDKRIVACDIPSGIRCDRGGHGKYFVTAEKTVTFAFYKPCMFMFPSRDLCGEIILADIGMPEEAINEQAPLIEFVTNDMVKDMIRPRPQSGHKGTFGTVQLVVGSELMTGAAVFCCKGALKSGVGLAYLSLPEKARQILQSTLYEPVYTMPDAMAEATAQVVGPGLGMRKDCAWTHLNRSIPTVADADAVNLIADKAVKGIDLPMANMLLTPHPAEFGRLVDKRAKEVEDDRFRLARDYAVKKGCVLLLKGRYTIIALPDGRMFVNTTGNTGLSKGGSGDVLAGYAGGLLAQGYTLFEAAIISAYLHGKAADMLVRDGREEAEILPADILDYIGRKGYLLGTL